MTTPNLWVCAVLVAAGILLHFLKKGYEAEQTGVHIAPIDYLKNHPYGSLSMVLSAYMLTAFWFYIGELTYATAILTGVGCNSAFDTLRSRAEARLRV